MIVMTLDDIIMIVSSMTLLNKTPMTMSYSSLFSTYENMISEGCLLGLRVQRAQCVTPTHRQPLMKKPPGNCMQITQKNLPPSNSNHFWWIYVNMGIVFICFYWVYHIRSETICFFKYSYNITFFGEVQIPEFFPLRQEGGPATLFKRFGY